MKKEMQWWWGVGGKTVKERKWSDYEDWMNETTEK